MRAQVTRAQFAALFEAQKQFGEPGFYFVADADYGANPCVEIGLHPRLHSFRRVQAGIHDPVYRHFRRANPHLVEPSVYDPNGRTEVIAFPVEGPAFGIYRGDLPAVKHLEYVQLVQKNWVQAGRRHERFSPGLHHNDLRASRRVGRRRGFHLGAPR